MSKQSRIFVVSLLSFACLSSAMAATPVNLQHQPVSFLKAFNNPANSLANSSGAALKQISSDVDFNQTTHIRVKQTYAGYEVWGGDVVVHAPRAVAASLQDILASNSPAVTMNGVIYQNLAADLGNKSLTALSSSQANQALNQAIAMYQKTAGSVQPVGGQQAKLIVYYSDKDQKAHWAYFISFTVRPANAMPAQPTYIMDAQSFEVYKKWDNIQTIGGSVPGAAPVLTDATGGGFGGNLKTGQLAYDGLIYDMPTLAIKRDPRTKVCYLENSNVTVKDASNKDAVVMYGCAQGSKLHNSVYWNGNFDEVNGGHSPSNDALYDGQVIKDMYQKWYGIPVLTEKGKPMMLVMRVHENMDNASWDGHTMTFGDGISMFYPLTSLGVGAHEVSHGFTQQHSGLAYYAQSGGLNEAFSDMAAQAAEYYAYGQNSWQIGPEIFKRAGEALRYMDQPSKDCQGKKPGDWCSIDNMSEYNDSLDVHFTSGIFNRAFYIMAKNWGPTGVKKAFDVMVQANSHYWTANTTFADAACGVVKATQDFKYNMDAVNKAMQKVGIDISAC